ncbi:Wadjet anti-phage system protein JetD domain-containing protein [Sulfurovum sp.]|jgi:hypothetical protein|uniref:Wadjet anti-phage system protein JetD domain-containing protein n=1 Tax=Sulfurovum sp. TaxID=1969726 RepID=UPI002A366236|nr:Wadjet anti-phage system protein JetD domain-containing protein [Sulfurovum sp.]MDY0401906.1 DUF2220 family protein [Sulfurovum sp.]
MYNVEQLYKKVNRVYDRGDIFISYIKATSIFPLKIPLSNIKESQIQKSYQDIIQEIKKLENSGLPLEYREFAYKSLGKQRLPVKVVFPNLEVYLQAIQKEDEYKRFCSAYDLIIDKYPTLKTFFAKKPFIVLAYEDVWNELLEVMDFLQYNPKPNIYIRELSIENVDTKFIEKYKKILDTLLSYINEDESLASLANYAFEKKYHFLYPEPAVRFRLLDESLAMHNLSDISLTKSEFSSLQISAEKVFIVENKITTLSFPKVKNAIVIFGQGYGVGVLKNIPWLANKEILYWGDIDLDGYAILSRLRGYYPQTRSFLMDYESFKMYRYLGVTLTQKQSPKILHHLSENEKKVYDLLCADFQANSFRIEQEKIPFDGLISVLKNFNQTKGC